MLVLGLTCGVVAVGALSVSSGTPSAPGSTGPGHGADTTSAEPVAVEVLHSWDVRRADAWARGDRAALSRLYTPGSGAGAADVALLGRYSTRGLVVRDLHMQLLRVRVLVMRPRRLELEVTDRVAGATALRASEESVRRTLPADRPTTRRLVLRLREGEWLMAQVSAPAGSRRR